MLSQLGGDLRGDSLLAGMDGTDSAAGPAPRSSFYSTLAKTAVVPPALVGKLAAAGRRDYTPQFPLRLMRKDFWLIIAAAEESGLFMPATESAAVVNAAEAASGREEDFSAVIRLMEERFTYETISST
jgi:3-hydroxyisobutyrate dehydrogenase-like beta-hydroxyacid dehydrogenase